ncbi:cysteine peptidase family C39 domain-containing protein [Ascidiimonas sp. W6]|uniref:cysteine peptidase family C39 domain-containing protein n=1 Tax=Ascidiimonas meishanensis TaxID=3128903 RepID=UPI0030EB56D5
MDYKTIGVKLTLDKLKDAPLPRIAYWNKNHFAVVYKIKFIPNFRIETSLHGIFFQNLILIPFVKIE